MNEQAIKIHSVSGRAKSEMTDIRRASVRTNASFDFWAGGKKLIINSSFLECRLNLRKSYSFLPSGRSYVRPNQREMFLSAHFLLDEREQAIILLCMAPLINSSSAVVRISTGNMRFTTGGKSWNSSSQIAALAFLLLFWSHFVSWEVQDRAWNLVPFSIAREEVTFSMHMPMRHVRSGAQLAYAHYGCICVSTSFNWLALPCENICKRPSSLFPSLLPRSLTLTFAPGPPLNDQILFLYRHALSYAEWERSNNGSFDLFANSICFFERDYPNLDSLILGRLSTSRVSLPA